MLRLCEVHNVQSNRQQFHIEPTRQSAWTDVAIVRGKCLVFIRLSNVSCASAGGIGNALKCLPKTISVPAKRRQSWPLFVQLVYMPLVPMIRWVNINVTLNSMFCAVLEDRCYYVGGWEHVHCHLSRILWTRLIASSLTQQGGIVMSQLKDWSWTNCKLFTFIASCCSWTLNSMLSTSHHWIFTGQFVLITYQLQETTLIMRWMLMTVINTILN